VAFKTVSDGRREVPSNEARTIASDLAFGEQEAIWIVTTMTATLAVMASLSAAHASQNFGPMATDRRIK